MTKKPYTVIGYYRDNNQPWMEHVNAPDATSGAGLALISLSENSGGEPVVVEVIEGKHMGVLHNESLLMMQDGVMSEIGEP
jgi:hypothetical protein